MHILVLGAGFGGLELTTALSEAVPPVLPSSSSPSRLWWISVVPLPSRNSPPTIRTRSRIEMSNSAIVNSGLVSVEIYAIDASRPRRVIRARAKPTCRPRA